MLSVTINISGRAVAGVALTGIVVAISSLGIVRAEREGVRPDTKIFTCTSGRACVEGNASGKNVAGVFGNSAAGTGVQGNSAATNKNSGVAGVNSGTTGTGYGVYGRSSNGPGIYGTSTFSNAIEGHNQCCSGSSYTIYNPAGVAGYGLTNGVVGVGNPEGASEYFGSSGVLGVAYGIDNWTTNGGGNAAVQAYSAGTVDIFAGNSSSGGWCHIDYHGDLACKGSITGSGAPRSRHRTDTGKHVLAYASESATATIEDVGTGRMSGGVANVQIDPAFASVMGRKWYYVFLTPLGETRGLFVSMKTPSSFQVRETGHGRSNLEFDYRIVAHPLDASDDRLPLAPASPKLRFVRASR